MEVISINIKNPKAKKLITDLVDLDLIEINDPKKKIKDYLKKMRKNIDNVPSINEIALIVKDIRLERNATNK